MPPEPSTRLDARWTGANANAAAALGFLAAVGLGLSFASSRFELGESLPVDAERVAAAHERMNPNTASLSSLRRLPQLGPVRAGQIVKYRVAQGGAPFRDANDLMRVRGIGTGTAATIREYLEFQPAGG